MKANKKMISIAMLFAVALLSGCATTPKIRMNQIRSIRKNMAPKRIHQMIKAKTKKAVKVKYNNNSYLAEYTQMVTGSTMRVIASCGKYGCSYIPEEEDTTAPYVFLYKMRKSIYRLITWGFVSDLNKSKNGSVRAVMRKVEFAAKHPNKQ